MVGEVVNELPGAALIPLLSKEGNAPGLNDSPSHRPSLQLC